MKSETIRKNIYNRIFVGIEAGQVQLHGVEELSDDLVLLIEAERRFDFNNLLADVEALFSIEGNELGFVEISNHVPIEAWHALRDKWVPKLNLKDVVRDDCPIKGLKTE